MPQKDSEALLAAISYTKISKLSFTAGKCISVMSHDFPSFLEQTLCRLYSISYSRFPVLQQLACSVLKEMLHCSFPAKIRTLYILRMNASLHHIII